MVRITGSIPLKSARLRKIPARTPGMRFSEHLDGDGETISSTRANWIGRYRFEAKRLQLPKRANKKLGEGEKS
jgi:hypothetical protein